MKFSHFDDRKPSLALGWVLVIIWRQYGYLSHGDPCSGHWAHLARAMGPPKSFKIAVCQWFNGLWCVHKLPEQFSTLYMSKLENFAKTLFHIVTTHNDEICYVKHVLALFCVFFSRPHGCEPRGPAAAAALQPLPLWTISSAPPGGHDPQPAAPPPGWRWPQDFVQDLVKWARALAWIPGPAEVSCAELAMDYEAFAGRALPASPDHRLRGTRLPLGEWAQILRTAAGLVERHLVAGTLLCAAPLGRCRSLLPLGGRVCVGLSARPFFAARHEVMLRLMRLATHCLDLWVRRLRQPARMRPPGNRFLMDYYPHPLEGAPPPPSRRMPEGPAAQPPAGRGQWHLGRALLGVGGAIVPSVQKPGVGQ